MGYKAEIRGLREIVDQQSRKLGALYSLLKQIIKVKGKKTKSGIILKMPAFDLTENDTLILETEETDGEIIIKLKETKNIKEDV